MHHSFNYRNSIIHYEVYGRGTPVIFLHGFGEDSKIWQHQINFLREHCRLIVPDLPGSGQSGILNGETKTVSIEDYAECIYALALNEQITQCIMLGHSLGGYITLAFAEKHKEMLSGFGFVHSTAFADSDEKKATRKKTMDTIAKHGPYAFLKVSLYTLFAESFKKQHPEIADALVEAGRNFSGDALRQYTEAMMKRPDRTNVLASSEVPVLFILGDEDVAAPLNDLLQQVHLPRVSYIHILKNVGHMGMLEATEQVNNHLLDYIRFIESEYAT